jgi:sarcosine oxidase subunit alpha
MIQSGGSARLVSGGLVDRARPIGFTFDGRRYSGLQGDTLASALLANGVRLVGRSFKYHRPRGIYSAGAEEPNALVGLRTGSRMEPNLRATQIELYEGLEACSQNRWPSLSFDLRSINQWFAGLLPAGFYYKTFMWPRSAWLWYEKHIRQAAGLGVAPTEPDPDRYEHRYAHCDLLVIGAGEKGLEAACAAARRGDRVILVDERAQVGGSLLWSQAGPNGVPAADYVAERLAELAHAPEVRVLTRTTALGVYDQGMVNLLERVNDHRSECPPFQPRQRLWQVRAQRIVLATGAIERPIVFPDNDRPGVMLAGAVRAYMGQYAVLPGRTIVVFTNNDDAWRTAFAARAAGAAVTVVDVRDRPARALIEAAGEAGIVVHCGALVGAVRGRRAVTGVRVFRRSGESVADLDCDLLATSGGWTPTVHLWSQAGGTLKWVERLSCFVPDRCPQAIECIGAAAGVFDPDDSIEPFWSVPDGLGRGKRFVDIQDDVSVEDVQLAHRENYSSVEHLKRYTTLGMGTDQGKTSNINGLALMTGLRGLPIPDVGTTTFRPPYTPVAFGALAGLETDQHAQPTRRTPLHDWHVERGATMYTVGQWVRPRVYARPGETFREAWWRESMLVRERVGIMDVSTLGKIEVSGPDAGAFLHRIYCNNVLSLPVGKVRYGLMLREDGLVADDGTFARIADDRYYLTTTTANAARVLRHMEFALQWTWPSLRASALSVTDQYAQIALAGPHARDVLAALLPGVEVGEAALPPQGLLQAELQGVRLLVFRVSFSGERAYELAVEADYAVWLWEALLEAGQPWGIDVYGTEAMGVLRIEKGHVAGAELDGRVTATDLGLARLLRKDRLFVGGAMLDRPGLNDPARPALVGLTPLDPKDAIRSGSILIPADAPMDQPRKLGWISSATPSPMLGHSIALGFVEGGMQRAGETLHAYAPLIGERVAVQVVSPHFFDPSGERMKQ